VRSDLDRLIATGRVPPLIAILPDASGCKRANYYIDSTTDKVETAFTTDLIAHIDATYRTYSDRDHRIVGGYSMGGYGAMRFSLAHPALFRAGFILSPAVYEPLPPQGSSAREFGAFGNQNTRFDDRTYTRHNYPHALARFDAKNLELFIAAGDREAWSAEDDLGREARKLYDAVRRVSAIHAHFQIFPGGHDWDTWRPAFCAALLVLLH
jgi:enterochelin esterase-like enzyme